MHAVLKHGRPGKDRSWIATPPAPYRSLLGPPGTPASHRSLQRVSQASGSRKCPKQSRNSLLSLKIDCFETPETVSRLVLDPRAQTLSGDSCEGRLGLQVLDGCRVLQLEDTNYALTL